MSKEEIASLNYRGLQDNKKRKRIFQTFCNSKFDIILLQETHSTDETVIHWKKDWTGRGIFPSLNSTKSRVAILCKESKNFTVEFEKSDKAGQIISVTVETHTQKNSNNKYICSQYTLPAENLLWQTEMLCHTQIWSHIGWRLQHGWKFDHG